MVGGTTYVIKVVELVGEGLDADWVLGLAVAAAVAVVG